jgi:cytoskeleton protein RodZ
VADDAKVGAGETAPAEDAATVQTVGMRLRSAREAMNLSVTDVAQSLKFSPRQIELIEADDYAALPGNTVVRGFTRSYARLLRLDAEELLSLLDAWTPVAQADVRPPENMGIAADTAATRQFTPVVSATIVVALAALLLGLWHFFGPAERQQLSASAPVVQQDVAPVSAPAAQPVAESAPAGEPAGTAVLSAVPAGTTEPALLFVFEDRSWLEVADAAKLVLHSGENLPGTRLTLNGKPPFDIVVGNASKVKLTYGEREIDLVPYTRADVARLKVE